MNCVMLGSEVPAVVPQQRRALFVIAVGARESPQKEGNRLQVELAIKKPVFFRKGYLP